MKKKIYTTETLSVLLIAVLIFLTTGFFSGCDGTTTTVPDDTIIPVIIGQGSLSGNGAEGFTKQFTAITTETDWENLKTQLNSVNSVTDNFTETDIDFSLYQVIFVIDEIKSNGGWSVDITDITENSNNIVVTVSNLQTGNITSVMTQPFQIVKIPVSNKPVIFNDLTSEEELTECDSLYHYYDGEKIFVNQYLLNDYLLVGFTYQTSDEDIVNYINQTGLFHAADAGKIEHAYYAYQYNLIFVNLNENKTCSELRDIISLLEESPIVALADFVFCCEGTPEFCTSQPSSDYYIFNVKVNDVNDLSDLYILAAETNTLVIGQAPYAPAWYYVRADKNSKGSAMQMANYFYETGKFAIAEPSVIGCDLNIY
jgi:hypothetical protein